MVSRIQRYWRIIGTAIGFVIVGFGGLVVFPLLLACIRRPPSRATAARCVIRHSFHVVIGLMRMLGVLRYEITGTERLTRRGLLVLANHPTLIDILFLMSFVHRADCIVKSRLWRNPFVAATVRAAGYIRNDNGPQVIEDCIASLHGGSNLIVFPEGTRTPADGSIRLKRGAANIAVRALCNITPVVIRCQPRILGKENKWWKVPREQVNFRIEVKEEIDIRPIVAAAGTESAAARQLTAFLQEYFSREIAAYAIA